MTLWLLFDKDRAYLFWNENLEYSIKEARLSEHGIICWKTLGELALPKTSGVIIVGIRRDEKCFSILQLRPQYIPTIFSSHSEIQTNSSSLSKK